MLPTKFVTSLSGADKREVRDNKEKWWEYREKSKYFSNFTTFHIRRALLWHSYDFWLPREKYGELDWDKVFCFL
jgi:hypothetical protein